MIPSLPKRLALASEFRALSAPAQFLFVALWKGGQERTWAPVDDRPARETVREEIQAQGYFIGHNTSAFDPLFDELVDRGTLKLDGPLVRMPLVSSERRVRGLSQDPAAVRQRRSRDRKRDRDREQRGEGGDHVESDHPHDDEGDGGDTQRDITPSTSRPNVTPSGRAPHGDLGRDKPSDSSASAPVLNSSPSLLGESERGLQNQTIQTGTDTPRATPADRDGTSRVTAGVTPSVTAGVTPPVTRERRADPAPFDLSQSDADLGLHAWGVLCDGARDRVVADAVLSELGELGAVVRRGGHEVAIYQLLAAHWRAVPLREIKALAWLAIVKESARIDIAGLLTPRGEGGTLRSAIASAQEWNRRRCEAEAIRARDLTPNVPGRGTPPPPKPPPAPSQVRLPGPIRDAIKGGPGPVPATPTPAPNGTSTETG